MYVVFMCIVFCVIDTVQKTPKHVALKYCLIIDDMAL